MTDAVEKVPNYPAPIILMQKNLTDDRRIDDPHHVTEVAERVYLQATRSPTSLHENRVYSQKKF
jgi:hypothetical protein